MSTFDIVQTVIIGAIVLASAVVAFRKLMPKTSVRALGRLSAILDREGRSRVLRAFGRWMRPATAAKGGCGDGCGSCGGCGSTSAPASGQQPLTFKPRG